MAEFVYTGVDKQGKRVTGKLNVNSEGDLRMVLRSQGIRPSRITKPSLGKQDIGALLKIGVSTVPPQVLVVVTRQLQVLISSGIPLVQGIEVLAEQSVNPTMKNVLNMIKDRVSQGGYLWEAIAAYPSVFPKLYIALIRAGEASGNLDQMLKRLSRYLEDADRLKKMVKGAMIYPIVVISIGTAVIGLMMVFVIPKFEEILKQSNQELPLPTKMVLDASHFIVNNILYIIGGIFGGIYAIKSFVKTKEGRMLKDRFVFSSPIFGQLTQKAGVARFSRTLQTLLGSGINLIDAIDICQATIDNAVLEESVGRIRKDLEKGQTLGGVVGKLSVFPKMASQMISVGEATGNLDKMLEKVADFYEADVEALVAGMSKMIEPLVLVFLGGTVGGLMIAMYLPIFKLAGGVN
ncbi:MAG: type II secretion system F family protein [Bdellovibrionota bacterium]